MLVPSAAKNLERSQAPLVELLQGGRSCKPAISNSAPNRKDCRGSINRVSVCRGVSAGSRVDGAGWGFFGKAALPREGCGLSESLHRDEDELRAWSSGAGFRDLHP